MNYNRVVAVGRMVEAAKYTPSTAGTVAKATFTLAVNRPWDKKGVSKVDYIPCVAWGKYADAVAQYTSKGKEMTIGGCIRTSSTRNANGTWTNRWEVKCEEMSFGHDSHSVKVAKVATKLGLEDADISSVTDLASALGKSGKTIESLRQSIAKGASENLPATKAVAANPFED